MDEWYRRDKVLQPFSGRPLPAIRNQGGRFGRWLGTPDWLPLVMVTGKPGKGGEAWRPFRAGKAIRNRLLRPLREAVGADNLIRCASPKARPVPLVVRPSDLVVHESYRSSRGRQLVSVGIDGRLYQCDGLLPPEWRENWFLLGKGRARYLGRNLELLEWGDFNGDGKTELLFWHCGYNEDGYLLMSGDFEDKASYYWNYH